MISKYLSLLQIGFKQSLAYQADFLIGCIASLFRMAILSYIWMAVYRGAGSEMIQGRTLPETITYVLLAQVIWSFFDGNVEVLLGFKIRHGEVARDLLRPVHFQTMIFFDHFGFSLAIFCIQTIPALIIAMFCFPVHAPASMGHLLLALLSVLLAFVLYVSLSFIVGILGFWTKNLWGLGLLKKVMISALSGNLIPLYFYPEGLKKLVYSLPFREIIDTPLGLYQGTLLLPPGIALLRQAIWAVGFIIVSQFTWRYLKRKIEVFGG